MKLWGKEKNKIQNRMTIKDRAAMLARFIGLKQELEDARLALAETKCEIGIVKDMLRDKIQTINKYNKIMYTKANTIGRTSKGWHQETDLNQVFRVVRKRSAFSLKSCYGTRHISIVLEHTDGRIWLMSVNENHAQGANCIMLFEYKTKKGRRAQATDAQSVAFDKMIGKITRKLDLR
jgi:hypothetical protein